MKKRRADCKKKPVRKGWIEDIVVRETMDRIMNDAWTEAVVVSLLMHIEDEENRDLPLYERQLQETNVAINNMLNAIQQGVLTKSTKQRLDELEQTRDDLEIKIANEKMEQPRISEEFMRFWLERFRNLDMKKIEHRKMLIDTFVNAIFLYDDKMVLTFNFKEGQKTITFDELNKQTKSGETGSDTELTGEHKGLSTMASLCVMSGNRG